MDGRPFSNTVALVRWTDLSGSGKTAVEVVPDDDGIARHGVREVEVIAFGCTSKRQAERAGRFILQTTLDRVEGPVDIPKE